jgi:serine/threonine-protein kinase RsbW
MGAPTVPEPGLAASIELPADAAYVASTRIFGAALARQFGADEEAVEDLKLAISEACSSFIRAGAEDHPIRLEVLVADGGLSFRISGIALPDLPTEDETPSTPGRFASQVGGEVIQALFTDAEIVPQEGGSQVRFSLPLGPPQT